MTIRPAVKEKRSKLSPPHRRVGILSSEAVHRIWVASRRIMGLFLTQLRSERPHRAHLPGRVVGEGP
jgi:hypothetical protein